MNESLGFASAWLGFCRFYDHLTLHIIPGPRSISYFVFILLLPTALLIPPSKISHRQLFLIFLPLVAAFEIHAWRASGVLDVISTTVLQWSVVLLVCYDPRSDFRRVSLIHKGPNHLEKAAKNEYLYDKDVTLAKEQAYPQSLLERVPWVMTLLVSIRLTGWKVGTPAHDDKQPPPRGMSRTAFLKHALGIFVLNYIFLDVSAWYALTDPYFTTSCTSIDAPYPYTAPAPGFGGIILGLLHNLPPRLVRSSTLAAQIFGLVAGGFYPATFPVLGLNAIGIISDEWSPHTWPPFFGSFSIVADRGLQGLWGSWWHQMNRQINATPGRTLVDHIGVKRSSFLGRMIVTIVAFGLSGWMHMGMIPPKPLSTSVTPLVMRLNVAAFFWSQPLGFALEYTAVKTLDRVAPNVKAWPAAKLTVLIWVSAWLCLTLPLLTVPFREIGYWQVYPIPFSLIKALSGESSWTWR